MADMAHEKYRITRTVGAGMQSKSSVLMSTVMGLLGMGNASPAAQEGVRITALDGSLVKEINPDPSIAAKPIYELVRASWSTMSAEEFEGRWLRSGDDD